MTGGRGLARRPSTILVVDDEETNVAYAQALLTPHGYRVVTARDGIEALAVIAEERPDVVLLDVMMPGLSGYDVCARLRDSEETRLLPVVLVTSLSDTDHVVQGLEVGADEYLTKPFRPRELLARVRSLLKLKAITDELETAETVLLSLGRSVEAKDPYTEGHCERLARYAVRLGEQVGLPQEQIEDLRRGGFLHDIGKIGIPDAILLKQGSLSVGEWAVMRDHPVIGERICQPLKSLRNVLHIIRHHHERWDGSGYPDGLARFDIPLTAQILQVADIYDALMTVRPYKPALRPDDAAEILRDEVAKGWRHRDLIETFLSVVPIAHVASGEGLHPNP